MALYRTVRGSSEHDRSSKYRRLDTKLEKRVSNDKTRIDGGRRRAVRRRSQWYGWKTSPSHTRALRERNTHVGTTRERASERAKAWVDAADSRLRSYDGLRKQLDETSLTLRITPAIDRLVGNKQYTNSVVARWRKDQSVPTLPQKRRRGATVLPGGSQRLRQVDAAARRGGRGLAGQRRGARAQGRARDVGGPGAAHGAGRRCAHSLGGPPLGRRPRRAGRAPLRRVRGRARGANPCVRVRHGRGVSKLRKRAA